MIKVIIFDLDGLLVDSQPLQYKAYNLVFSEMGFPLSRDDWLEWIHESLGAKSWIQKKNLPLDAEEIRNEKKRIYNKLIVEEMKLKPGALKLINALHGKFKLCLASSSYLEQIMLALNKFNLATKFEKILSDSEMAHGKPQPDIFLHAAKLMNVKPEECLVIEDSLAGLQAAKTAKMKCIICPDTSFPNTEMNKFKDADRIVQRLDEITSDSIY